MNGNTGFPTFMSSLDSHYLVQIRGVLRHSARVTANFSPGDVRMTWT
jgi:hypothetical protein